jgi:hypothetical protein
VVVTIVVKLDPGKGSCPYSPPLAPGKCSVLTKENIKYYDVSLEPYSNIKRRIKNAY